MRLILIGAPGAGKGTQAVIISNQYNIPQIASGDIFRDAQNKGTERGSIVQSYMQKGLLVPDEIAVKVILERLCAPDTKPGFILDGFPRTIGQAIALDKALAEIGQKIDKVVYINVPQEELLKRLSGRWICRACQAPYHIVNSPPKIPGKCDICGSELYQRADDTVETIKKRLTVFIQQTTPLIEYYKKTKNLFELDGNQPIESVSKDLLSALHKYKK